MYYNISELLFPHLNQEKLSSLELCDTWKQECSTGHPSDRQTDRQLTASVRRTSCPRAPTSVFLQENTAHSPALTPAISTPGKLPGPCPRAFKHSEGHYLAPGQKTILSLKIQWSGRRGFLQLSFFDVELLQRHCVSPSPQRTYFRLQHMHETQTKGKTPTDAREQGILESGVKELSTDLRSNPEVRHCTGKLSS